MRSSCGISGGNAGREFPDDGEKFVHPVRAGVPRADRLQAVPDKVRSECRVVTHCSEMTGDFLAVMSNEKVLPGAEQIFRVVPGRRDQGYTAGERLEHTNGRNTRQDRRVIMARNVNGGEVGCEDLRGASVGCPAVVAGAMAGERRPCRPGIAYPVDVERQPCATRGTEEEAAEFPCAFAVTPISDPDEPLAPAA